MERKLTKEDIHQNFNPNHLLDVSLEEKTKFVPISIYCRLEQQQQLYSYFLLENDRKTRKSFLITKEFN